MSTVFVYALCFITRIKNENRIHSIRFMKHGIIFINKICTPFTAKKKISDILGTKLGKIYRTFYDKILKFLSKFLKVPNFILKSFVDIIELCSGNTYANL